MRPAKLHVLRRCGAALTLVAGLALATGAEAFPKRPTLVNKCACACMSETHAVVINFTSIHGCKGFNGKACKAKLPGSTDPAVVGKWDLCLSNGKKSEMR